MLFNKISVLTISLVYLNPILVVYALEKKNIGWLEKISINGSKTQLIAKIDTGATTSSIHAEILKNYKLNNEDWVRFQIQTIDNEEIVLERKVHRVTKIKRKRTFSISRPVVIIGICIGDVYKEEEVNLSNREKFNYPVLIGRNYLKGSFLVDSDETFTTPPICNFHKK